ncbi:unnamed protein product [Gadus morhua 'NCC']
MSKRGPSRHQTLRHFCNTMGLLGFFKDYILGFLDYETPKVMVVRNRNLGVIYRGVQFLVITYFIWYVFIKEKAYQDFESGLESSVTTRMKGTAVQGGLVHDSEEYAHPSEGFEVMSTTVRRDVTHDQRQATCAEHFSVPNANCSEDSDCREGEVDFDGHGPRTGRCVPYYDQSFRTCEIQAWCPVEEYAAGAPLLEAFNFTIVIKNAIRFPSLTCPRANGKDFSEEAQLSSTGALPLYHATIQGRPTLLASKLFGASSEARRLGQVAMWWVDGLVRASDSGADAQKTGPQDTCAPKTNWRQQGADNVVRLTRRCFSQDSGVSHVEY